MATITGAGGRVPLREDRRFILANLSAGHAVTHAFSQSFVVVLPYIQSSMGFGDLKFGLILSIRQLATGATNIPMGFLVDMLRRQWGLIFAGCMVGVAGSFVVAGSAPGYWVLVVAAAIVALPGALWHLPAFALLSQRFPDRRGFAISTHGAGGNLGGALGPLLAGVLLGALGAGAAETFSGSEWRYVLFIYAGPAFLMAFPILWALRDIGTSAGAVPKTALNTRIRDAAHLFRNPAIIAIILVLLLRGMGFNALTNWSPKYLSQTAELSPFWVGFDMAVFIGMGIVFSPLLGAISDKVGRKQVLLPGLAITGLLAIAVVQVGSSVLLLTLIFASMGPFSFTLGNLLQASVLDIAGRGTEATSVGLVMGTQSLVLAGSPLLVGQLSDMLGIESLFYYAAVLMVVAIVVLLVVPIQGRAARTPAEARAG